jgi:hypothetical protein
MSDREFIQILLDADKFYLIIIVSTACDRNTR